MIMDNKEIEILREQLRVKDEQIERLQVIIENLTRGEEEEDEKEPKPHVPTFWEKHPKVAYAVFGLVLIAAIAIFFFPVWWKSLWGAFGNSAGMIYTFSTLAACAFAFLCWMQMTKGGRKFMD